jgi:hypothetical protein
MKVNHWTTGFQWEVWWVIAIVSFWLCFTNCHFLVFTLKYIITTYIFDNRSTDQLCAGVIVLTNITIVKCVLINLCYIGIIKEAYLKDHMSPTHIHSHMLPYLFFLRTDVLDMLSSLHSQSSQWAPALLPKISKTIKDSFLLYKSLLKYTITIFVVWTKKKGGPAMVFMKKKRFSPKRWKVQKGICTRQQSLKWKFEFTGPIKYIL